LLCYDEVWFDSEDTALLNKGGGILRTIGGVINKSYRIFYQTQTKKEH